jgi:dihydroorotate dehydrogenase
LFRIKKDKALINRMGFNNKGLDYALKKLGRKKSGVIVGGNIGKNKWTEGDDAIRDFEICFEKLFDHVDYFSVNVSSPNTPGLRDLQEKEPLKNLLARLQLLNSRKEKQKPILLKIAPDLTFGQLDDIVEIVKELKIDGVIATNTTTERVNLTIDNKEISRIGMGGLSGKPLRDRSTEVIRYLRHKSEGDFHIIGVGGIMNPDDAIDKLMAGASLIQVYTGFVYQGPGLVKKINKKILQKKAADRPA